MDVRKSRTAQPVSVNFRVTLVTIPTAALEASFARTGATTMHFFLQPWFLLLFGLAAFVFFGAIGRRSR
jgi:hypothetical protein